jgi:hypothetical protein
VRVQGVIRRLSVTFYCEIMPSRLIDKNFGRFPSVIIIGASYSCVSDASRPINRPQCPSGLRRGSAFACLVGLRIESRWGLDVCPCDWYVYSGRGICDGPIIHPEESYRACPV